MVCKATIKCEICGEYYTNNNFKKHNISCDGKTREDRKPLYQTNGKRGGWNKGLTKETDDNVKKIAATLNEGLASGRIKMKSTPHTVEFKNAQSIRAYARGLGGHTSKQQLYYLRKDGTEIYLQSSYEIRFAKLLDELEFEWCRPPSLHWVDELGKPHRYYPDFLVGNIYIDTKNDYLAVKDKPKIDAVIKQNNVDIRVVTEKFINKDFIKSLQT